MNQQLGLNLLPQQAFSFDNFIPGENVEVLTTLMNLSSGRSIYLFGDDGCGKTHLLKAITEEHDGIYYNLKRFPKSFDQINFAAYIAIDDIEQFTDAQQASLFDLINDWKLKQATPQAFSLILASNKAPKYTVLREDLRNRLAWDLSYKLEALKDEDILVAIEQRAFDKDVKINAEACRWLLNHCDRNIPSLYAWLDALDLYSMTKRRQITLTLIKNFLQEPGADLLQK